MIIWETARVERRKGKTETCVDVLCPICESTRRVTLSTAKRSSQCATCSRQANLQHTSHQHQPAWIQGVRRRLLRDMSAPEILVQSWLEQLHIPYVSQAVFVTPARIYFIDFTVGKLAIEVNGYHHKKSLKAAGRDELLARAWTGDILNLDGCELAKKNRQQSQFNKLVQALQGIPDASPA